MEIQLSSISFFFTLFAFLVWWLWSILNWVWLKPKRFERYLRQQGLQGNRYRLFHGVMKDATKMLKDANSRTLNIQEDICPRVLPMYHHIIKKYGKSSFTWIGPIPRVNIMEPELIQEILLKTNNFKKFKPSPLVSLLVKGLPFYEDEQWTKHRKVMNPAFQMEKLKNMLPAIYLSCSEMITKWESLVLEKGSSLVDVQPCLEHLTSDVISRTAFGTSYEDGKRIFELQKEQAHLARKAAQKIYIPGWRFVPTKINKRMKEINNEILDIIKNIVKRRKSSKELGKSSEDGDLLGLLLKSNQQQIQENGNNKEAGITFEEVMENCKVFYFAGQESTSNLLVWTMVLLSIHPEWQLRARKEINEIFGNKKPDFEGLNRLKIVTMILYEVLRLYPPAVILLRDIYKETKLGTMTFPPGVQLMIPIMLVHRDHELWGEDAKEFKPERFSEGIVKATNNQLAFFPFSWGPRICIGNNFALIEVKLALVMILQRLAFELSPSYAHTPTFVMTLQPQKGAHLILHKIQ